MKQVTIVISISVLIHFICVSCANNYNYSKKYDHIHINAILSNRKIVHLFVLCFLGKSACSPEGKELKHILPEALRNSCKKCTQKQKSFAFQIFNKMQSKYPDLWSQLMQKWDPTGENLHNFTENLANDVEVIEISSEATPNQSIITSTVNPSGDNATEHVHVYYRPKKILLSPLVVIDKIGRKVIKTSSEIASVILNSFDTIMNKKIKFLRM